MPENIMTNSILQIHLSSWRYFALLTLPPLLLAFDLLYSPESVVLLILFTIVHYYCWRLWLDERLFQLLNNDTDLLAFDKGMACLWKAKSERIRPLAERWHGARRLFYRGILMLALLWLASLYSVIDRALG
jgi:hypothetical protein